MRKYKKGEFLAGIPEGRSKALFTTFSSGYSGKNGEESANSTVTVDRARGRASGLVAMGARWHPGRPGFDPRAPHPREKPLMKVG
jgi:hypothetical protein